MNISLVIPVLNEEDTIPIFYREICKSPDLASYNLELIFINDGSTDNTLSVLQNLQSAIRNPQSAKYLSN
ncbi:glycosyltransferase [Actinobacillus succinogenes]|uniref:glycosyltransferase n=1 Tax=Actinobacillus succinogenes TaxID=67854 RepID=UPI00005B1A27|nr:glycosyltransferase [Actinobacillus succinogenes]